MEMGIGGWAPVWSSELDRPPEPDKEYVPPHCINKSATNEE
jgi:hypothetical protein